MSIRRPALAGGVIALAAVAISTFAQPPAQSTAPAAPPARPAAARPAAQPAKPPLGTWQDKDVRHLVHVVMMARMAEELNLTDEETVKLVRRFEQHRTKMEDVARDRSRAAEDLRTAIKNSVDDKEIKQKLDALKKLDSEQFEQRRQTVNDISADLTPIQQAKLYVFMNEFENNVRQMIQRARELGADRLLGGGGGNAPAAGARRQGPVTQRLEAPAAGQPAPAPTAPATPPKPAPEPKPAPAK